MEETRPHLTVEDATGEVIHEPAFVLYGNGDDLPHAPSNFDDVVAFQKKFGLPVAEFPRLLPGAHEAVQALSAWSLLKGAEDELLGLRAFYQDDQFYGRIQMMVEELREMVDHARNGDMAGVFDSLIDLVYFAHGTAAMMGLPWQLGWDEVQNANMAKIRVQSHEESIRKNKLDVVKPAGWQPPDLHRILFAAQRASFEGHKVAVCHTPTEVGPVAGDPGVSPEDGVHPGANIPGGDR